MFAEIWSTDVISMRDIPDEFLFGAILDDVQDEDRNSYLVKIDGKFFKIKEADFFMSVPQK